MPFSENTALLSSSAVFWSTYCGSSLLNARNASFRIAKLSVNSEVHCSVCENKPPLDSVHNVGECTLVVLEQNSVLQSLAALLAQSQFSRMNCSVEMS